MKIFEIDAAIAALIDENGEVADFDQLEALQMERDEKIENLLLWAKESEAEAKAIREEEKALADRRKTAERNAERLKAYVATVLAGEKFKTPRVAVSYRTAHAVEMDDELATVEWLLENGRDDLLKYTAPTVSKTALSEFLKGGGDVPGVRIVDRVSVVVK